MKMVNKTTLSASSFALLDLGFALPPSLPDFDSLAPGGINLRGWRRRLWRCRRSVYDDVESHLHGADVCTIK